jgi:tripartite-type tricarboxylate transporter receptor subunit TctC
MIRIVSLIAALVVVDAAPVRAQTYPERPIRILVPYAPGGITDIAGRIIAAKLTEAWGQQVVVENKPGGSGMIAVTAAARSIADGYTLLLATAGDVAINPLLFKQMPYDVDRDLAPITLTSSAPLVLAANAGSPYRSVADVLTAAKAQPGIINLGTPGYGSINHVTLEWLSLVSGTKFQHIPYKGGAPAAQAVVAGDIPLVIVASSSVAPHVKSGSIRVLAVTMANRSPLNPEWPTLQEEGVPEVDTTNWTALFAPKATPQPIVDRLNAEVVKILNQPDVKERFAAGGVDTIPSTAAELDARIKREGASFKTIVEKANIHVE